MEGQGLTPEQLGRDGICRNRLAGAIRRQAPGVPGEAAQQVRWITATRDETNGTLLNTWARTPTPQPAQQKGGPGLPSLTVGELIALLQQLPPELPVDAVNADDYLAHWRLHGPGQDLNDGVRPTSSDTTITVADYGRWMVRVQACNTAGCGGPVTKTFEVEPAPEPTATPTPTPEPAPMPSPTLDPAPVPTATATPAPEATPTSSATAVPTGEQITLSANISNAPAGSPTYSWEMATAAGGSPLQPLPPPPTSSRPRNPSPPGWR